MKSVRFGFFITTLLGLFTLFGLVGCGGGGGSSTSSSVSGTVNASILKGVKVCIKGTSTCATTDANGRFTINGFAPPQTLEIFVGDSKLGEVTASSSSIAVTPKLLADNNATSAPYIGAMLHKIGGCAVADATCDLSNVTSVDINDTETKSLIEELKDALQQGLTTVALKVDHQDKNVTSADISEYETEYPEMVSDSTRFSGAASVGDFATFSYDKDTNKLTYEMNGSVFGAHNGAITLTNVNGNVFFKDSNDNFYFFSKSLAVAQIPVGDNNVSYIAALQMPHSDAIDPSLFVNKRFNYIEFNSAGSPSFAIIDINATSPNDTNGTWTMLPNNAYGTWELNGSHLDIKDARGTKIANAIIRPATKENGRAGFVLDMVSGGFGIGVEAKPLTDSELSGTFYYYNRDLNTSPAYNHWECYGKITVNGISFQARDSWCSNGDTGGSFDDNLTLNPDVNLSGSNMTLNGIAKVSNTQYAFIDPESGYYISIDFSEPMISIGSNKSLK